MPTPPPHCPFDANVITKLTLPSSTNWNWTQLDAIEDYRTLVAAAKAKAGSVSLAVWERLQCNNDYQ